MPDLRVVGDDESNDEAPTEGGFTVGDAAHSIAELASDIHKRFKGWTPMEALRAVEIAMNQHMTQQALELQFAATPIGQPELSPEALAALEELAGLPEDDPTTQQTIPTVEGY